MTASVRYLNRQVLQNVLHHVDTHNRLMEEKEMWKMKQNMKPSSSDSEDGEWRRSGPVRRKNYGRMRSDNVRLRGDSNRNIFKQKLDDGKWNHSGFMELYPDEFLNKESMDEMSSDEDKERKGKKKKRKKIHESMERNGSSASSSHEKTVNHSNAKLANHKNARTTHHEYAKTNDKSFVMASVSNAKTSHNVRDKRKQIHLDEKVRLGKKFKYSEEISESSSSSDEWNALEATVFDLKNSPEKKRKARSDPSPQRLKDKRRRRKGKKEKHRRHEKRKRSKHDIKR